MGKQIIVEFSRLHDALERYEREIEATLAAYRQDLAAARQRADQYKDSTGELERARQELVAPARAHIAAADLALSKVAGEVAGALREALAQRVAERPNAGFVDTLRALSDLGVKLSAGEIRALVPCAQGGYLSLRMLASLAERSGYRLTTPSFDEYEKNLRDIERLCRVPVMFVPMEYVREGADVLEDKPRFAPDGRLVYSLGRPDTVYLASMSRAFKALERRIDGAADRWSVDFVPTLSELKPVKDANGETVTPEAQRAEAVQRAADAVKLDEQEAVRLSAAEAAEQAQAEHRAAEIRARFVGR